MTDTQILPIFGWDSNPRPRSLRPTAITAPAEEWFFKASSADHIHPAVNWRRQLERYDSSEAVFSYYWAVRQLSSPHLVLNIRQHFKRTHRISHDDLLRIVSDPGQGRFIQLQRDKQGLLHVITVAQFLITFSTSRICCATSYVTELQISYT